MSSCSEASDGEVDPQQLLHHQQDGAEVNGASATSDEGSHHKEEFPPGVLPPPLSNGIRVVHSSSPTACQ